MAIIINGKRVAGTGKPGKSAYEIAIDNGYQGEELDFGQDLGALDEIKASLTTDTNEIIKVQEDYYTKAEVDQKIEEIDVSEELTTAIQNAKDYTDEQIANNVPDVSGQINAHDTNSSAHGDIRNALNAAIQETRNYVDAEIAAIPTPDVSGQIGVHNASGAAHADIRSAISSAANAAAAYTDEKVSAIVIPVSSVNNKTGAVSLTHTDVGADKSGSAAAAESAANAYTNQKIADLIGGAPTTLDTLDELAAALKDNANIVDVLNDAIGTKANTSDLTSHVSNKNNPHAVTATQVGARPNTWMPTAADVGAAPTTHTHTKSQITDFPSLATVATSGSYNDLSNKPTIPTTLKNPTSLTIQGNGTTSATYDGSAAKTINIKGSGATTVSADSSGNITISSTDNNTVYTHPTTSGNKHIPSGGSSGQILRWSADGTAAWGADNNTTYSASTGLSLSGTAFSLATSGVTAGSYGPTANVSGSNNATINVPQITVDAYGRVTSVTNRVYTSVNTDSDTKNTAGTTNSTSILYLAGATSQGANPQTYSNSAIKANCNASGANEAGSLTATKIYGAVWNDYAEYREADTIEAGRVVCENGDDTLSLSSERLQPGANIISDTFGFSIGETETAKTPLAVSGRVLAYPYEDRDFYKPGDAVCAAPNGTVSKMTREEIREYPERILGTVSSVPAYETWGTGNVPVNGRIWIKVK